MIGALGQLDVASDFANGEPIRGEAGDERADQMLEDNASAAVFAVNFAGQIADGVPVRDDPAARAPRRA